MPSQGPLAFTSWASLTGGFGTWADPHQASVSDDTRATVSLTGSDYSDTLQGVAAPFSIPSDATIDGVLIEVEASAPSGDIADNYVDLYKNGVLVNNSHASLVNLPAADAVRAYGGASDLWGTTWTPAQINDPAGFGVAYGLLCTGASGTGRVDAILATVFYTLPTPPPHPGYGRTSSVPVDYARSASAAAAYERIAPVNPSYERIQPQPVEYDREAT